MEIEGFPPEDISQGHFMCNFQNAWSPWDAGHLLFPWNTRIFNGSEQSNLMVPSFYLPDRVQWTNWSRRQTWPWLWGPIPGGTSSWKPSLSVQVRGLKMGTGLAGRSRWHQRRKSTTPSTTHQLLERSWCPVFSPLVLDVCISLGLFEKDHGVTKRTWLSLALNSGSAV